MTEPTESPSLFVYKLIPPRPSFAGDMSDAEAAVMAEHGAYWQRHMDEGRVVVFGPVVDSSGSWGLAVVRAESADDVAALGREDPAVTSGTCTFDVGTMPVAVVPD
jgi:uncharacterized protein YciI